MKKSALLGLSFLFIGCASRSVRVMDASWVSMRHTAPPDNPKKMTRVATIDETYCMEKWSGSFGLMDEVVKQAEAKHNIDYIKSPIFSKDENRPCVTVIGEGFRIVQ
jgi:hypothetical protein